MKTPLGVLLAAALAVGCDDGGGVVTVDMGPDMTEGEIDARVIDMLVPPDMGEADMPVEADMRVEPDMRIEPDMRVEPDMLPDMPAPMCAEAGECDDDNTCTEDACSDGMCSNTPIEGCCTGDADCGGGRCLDAINQCADAVAPGAVIITELLVDAIGVSDADGEWFEVFNVSDAPVVLNGWRVEGGENEAFELVPEGLATLEPGARAIFGRNADMATNGGVAVDYVYNGFALANAADRIALVDALGTVVDQVVYDENWPIEPGATLSLAPGSSDATANDDPANWCPASMAWNGADRGSPGAANPECVPNVPQVDWCRLQFPLDAEVAAGAEVTVYARVFEEGITDLSDAVDVDPTLVVQIGFGGDATDPAAAEWTWVAADPNLGWNAAAAGEPGNDEYLATFNAPDPGVYDHAARASVDGGETWMYCDRNAGPGSDGAEDGYQIANAGSLNVLPAGCVDLVCNTPPTPRCDGNAVIEYAPEGRCVDGADGVECAYDELEPADCPDEQICERGECIMPAPAPDAAGQLLITEILYDPHGPLAEGDAEWFEVQNTTDGPLRLDGCRISDADNVEVVEGLTIEPGQYAVFGRNADQAVNGGIPIDYVFGFGLNNGGDAIGITCGPEDADVLIDQVVYGESFPNARRASIALDPAIVDPIANGEGANWCVAENVYYMPADQPEAEWHRGTPGAANPPCPEPDISIDWCRLQFPLDPVVGAGTALTVYGRVFEEGITDRSPGTDIDQRVMAQFGLGPVGSNPDDTWNWTAAAPNVEWNDAAEPGNDEYQTEIIVPAPGFYAFAYRFSRDMGATWLYCDRNAGLGSDGAEDGYQTVNGGLLNSQAGPCDDVVCNMPPAPVCDGDVRVESAPEGACNDVDGVGVCVYDAVRTDCTLDGGRCDAGNCVDAAQPPAADELVITELLYDPQNPLTENDAEWVEVLNTTDRTINLNGCALYDSANTEAIDQPLLIEAGAYALFGKSQDQAENGGLNIVFTFGFGLNNTGDTVGIRCGETVVDELAYDDGPAFPDGVATSISLSDPALDNADGANWCLGEAVYFEDAAAPHRGTPGLPNPACPEPDPCEPNPCMEPPAAVCDGNVRRVPAAVGRCTALEGGVTQCEYPLENVPCAAGEMCMDGECVDAVCDPNPCDAPPADACADGNTRLVYPPQGACADVDGAAECDYVAEQVPCAGDEICQDGACVAAPDVCDPNPCDMPPANGCANENTRIVYPAEGVCADADGMATCDYPGQEVACAANELCEAGACVPAPDPCDPNPCNMPPAPVCQDANTVLEASPEGICANVDGAAECDYNPQPIPCADGFSCVEGACVEDAGPRAPVAGEVVINEIMYDPHHGIDDGAGEWFELFNRTAEPLNLDTCQVNDAPNGVLPLAGLVLEPGGYLVFAKNADAALNGGLEPAGVFDFSLSNGGDSLTVVCDDAEIDTVTYDDGPNFPDARAHTISLADAALDNADGANWCLARSAYFADPDPALSNYGTPGAANDACDVIAEFGALQFPLSIDEQTGAEVLVFGRVYHPGLTDRTPAVDVSPLLRAQLGFGPDDSDPAADAGWIWINGQPNPAWDGAAVGQPNNDEYQVNLRVPAPGAYDYAWRFSADGGRNWIYADAEPAGSSDGYQIANAGQLTSRPQLDPCEPNPCNMPPAAACNGPDVLETYDPVGICMNIDGEAVCDYVPNPVPCEDGFVCENDACVEVLEGRTPAVGEVVVTEIMYDPHFDLQDGAGEWFEVHNPTEDQLLLDGCVATEGNGGTIAFDGLTLEPGGYLLFAKSADEGLNGGLTPDGVFDFSLNNGGDSITVTCDGVDGDIDTVAYDDGPDFPDGRARSISLDPGAVAANEDGANWCLARDVYYQAADPAENNFGTPGQPNPPCDQLASFGRLQFPLSTQGPMTTVYGRVFHPGITDRSPATDPSPFLIAELGFGPDGSDPAAGEWQWTRGAPNAEYDGNAAGEPNNDEYQADLIIPGGIFDYAWRFSADAGRTWLYADGQAAGSSDGYQPENAGDAQNVPQ